MIFFLLVGLGTIVGMLSIGAAVETARTGAARMQEAPATAAAEANTITDADDYPAVDMQPSGPDPEADAAPADAPETRDGMSDIIDDTPAETGFAGFASSDLAGAIAPPPMVREFSSADGRFRVRAEYLGSDGDTVQLRREDTGRELSVPIDRLSVDDQTWIAERSAQQ